jgi:hypothetical protein
VVVIPVVRWFYRENNEQSPRHFTQKKLKWRQIRPKKRCFKKYSFFPRYRDWNQLSDELLDIERSEEFKNRLTKLYYGGWTTWTKDDDFILILITFKWYRDPVPLFFVPTQKCMKWLRCCTSAQITSFLMNYASNAKIV